MRNKNPSYKAEISILLVLFLLFLLLRGATPVNGAEAVRSEGQAAGTFQMKVTNGYLSLEANETPLVQIFEEIGKQARIPIDSKIAQEEKVTIRLERLPIEAAIKQLAKNVIVFYAEDPNSKTSRIARVVVLSGNEGAYGKMQSASKPAQVNEDPPQPEPFRFEFEPGKFAEKRRPRK